MWIKEKKKIENEKNRDKLWKTKNNGEPLYTLIEKSGENRGVFRVQKKVSKKETGKTEIKEWKMDEWMMENCLYTEVEERGKMGVFREDKCE